MIIMINIKEKIFIDTLNIVGITPFSHDETAESLDEIYKYEDPIEETIDFAFCELTRPKGNFDLIFPLKTNIEKYRKLIRKKCVENENFFYLLISLLFGFIFLTFSTKI